MLHLRKTQKTPLIDVELLLYKNAAAIDAGTITFTEAVRNVEDETRSILKVCGAAAYKMVVSGRNNYRKVLYPDTYKANRPAKPVQYYNLLEAVKANHSESWLCHDQLEADDLLGIMATNGRITNPIICSIDKDMLTIPCWHYQWHHDIFPHEVTQEDADQFWLKQLLMGDSTDGIQGMKGIGPKKAEAMMEKHPRGSSAIPRIARYIYEREGFSLDEFTKCLLTVTIWRKPFPPEMLENELVASIAKTIKSL
jgi:5'-3' exonuclease